MPSVVVVVGAVVVELPLGAAVALVPLELGDEALEAIVVAVVELPAAPDVVAAAVVVAVVEAAAVVAGAAASTVVVAVAAAVVVVSLLGDDLGGLSTIVAFSDKFPDIACLKRFLTRANAADWPFALESMSCASWTFWLASFWLSFALLRPSCA